MNDGTRELARTEGRLALRRVVVPWLHAAVAALCAVLAWTVPGGGVRAVAHASVLHLPLRGLVAAPRLARVTWPSTLPGTQDGEEDGEATAVRPGPTGHVRALRGLFLTVGAVGAAVAALVPAAWIRWALPVLAFWAVAEAVRDARGRYRRARTVCRRAADAPWYDDCRALGDGRRAGLPYVGRPPYRGGSGLCRAAGAAGVGPGGAGAVAAARGAPVPASVPQQETVAGR